MRSDIGGYLESFGGEEVLYRPNPGNAGDSLIALGTYQMFARHGVRYRLLTSLPPAEDLTGRIVIYAGGGNLTPYYKNAAEFFAAHHAKPRRMILLPHTVRGHERLLSSFGPNVEIVCREQASHRHVTEHAPGATTLLMHDMAFSLDVEAALAPSVHRPTRSVRQIRKRIVLALRKRSMLRQVAAAARGGTRTLNCFREDRESSGIEIPAGNVDLPARFALGTAPEEVAHAASRELLRFIGMFDEVSTNRLHIGIGGALLGKRVNLYPNSYDKNQSVYEFSIRDRFPDVRWCG